MRSPLLRSHVTRQHRPALLAILRHRRHRSPAPQPALAATTPDPVIKQARELYGPNIAQGGLPAIRAIKRDRHVGTPRAAAIRDAITPATAPAGQEAA
jgi:hypothetical protein